MVAGVVRGRGVRAALPLLGAQRAVQRRGVEDGGGGDDEPQHDQPVHHVVSECDSVTGAYLHGNSGIDVLLFTLQRMVALFEHIIN